MTFSVPIGDEVLDEAILREPDEPWHEDEVLDQVLRLVADHHRALGLAIGRRVFSPSIAELRQSPLGRDLRLLAAAARGDALPDAVRAAADRLREILLRPLAADHYAVPTWFWATEVGRIVARAERAAANGSLIPLGQAEARLGVAPGSLTPWLEDGALPWVPAETGEPLVRRSTIERLRLVAQVAARPERVAPGEDALLHEKLSA